MKGLEINNQQISNTTTTKETIKIFEITIYIFTYLPANEIKEPELLSNYWNCKVV